MPEGFSIAESVTTVIDGLKSALPLLKEFPLNVYTAFGILGCGLGLFKFFRRKH